MVLFANNIAEHLYQKQINLTTPFYYEISKYSQSILANILRAVKTVSQISVQSTVVLGHHFCSNQSKNSKQSRETFTSNTLSWHRHVCKTIKPI